MLANEHEQDLELVELNARELVDISGGGTPLQYAMFYIAAFKAGFWFGYSELGPAIFGD